ncbi:MAG: hypothetical protein JOY55_03445, partial [Mycobacterium sp.]|nr:hypothetical protein [Mycobacterium sp.]
VPPIINAFNVSSGLSAREAAAENIEVNASNSTGATPDSEIIRGMSSWCRIRRRPRYSLVPAPIEKFNAGASFQHTKRKSPRLLTTRRGWEALFAFGMLVLQPVSVQAAAQRRVVSLFRCGRDGPLLGCSKPNMAVNCQFVESEPEGD